MSCGGITSITIPSLTPLGPHKVVEYDDVIISMGISLCCKNSN